MNCPTCGAANRAESRFCLSCGSRIELPGTVPSPMPPDTPSRRTLFLAAGVVGAAVVLLVGGLLVWGAGDDSENSSSPSPSRTEADDADDGEQRVSEVPSTSDPAPPVASITPTSAPPTTLPPTTTIEQTTVPVTAAPPAPMPEGFPFPNAFEVPRLGVEPVRGSACGADGSVGDVVPDGWWFGGVEGITSTSLLLDLVCVYFGAEAQVRIAECAASEGYDVCTAYWGEQFWPVNNTERYRVVPVAPDLVRAVDSTMGCSLVDVDRYERDEFTWVHIVGGQAVHLQHLCPGG